MIKNVPVTTSIGFRSPSGTCFSFPGRLRRAVNGQGQKLLLKGGANGCLDTAKDAAKFIANALGLRNEYNRPDRDQFITIRTENLRPGKVLLENSQSNELTVAFQSW